MVEEPAVEEPTVEEPAVELPPVEEPVVEEPVVEEPVVEEPVVEEPIVDEPPVEEPAVDEPVAEEPSAEDQPADDDADSVEVVTPVADSGDAASANDGEVGEASATEAISIRGLVKQFGDNRAVDGIDLTVPAGSFYGIVGPNGAGKTTTLSIVAGLLRADEGSVVICGIDQAKQPHAAKRVMGVLPDRLRTFDRLTGRQLLYYYGLLRGLAADVIEKRAADLARAFDLGDALSRVVSDYSAGMTKKIMLAGAMIHSPRVLVLDEPFESVDPVSSAVILDILRAYVSHGGTVILSSHGMDLVERVCSRVAIIVGGEVLAEGTIDEVRAGQTLEARFVELAGSSGEVEGLEWLHTFSA
ncbi:ATP-binding cassette domain-containing protein [Microbacterium sp. CGR2]|nr:ATP-binding cassette domain-containing protein [Microbacterium sp. CGR2]